MTHARPAKDSIDLRSRPVGERLVLPLMYIVGYKWREIRYGSIEQTVHDYTFNVVGDPARWSVTYSGQYRHGWKMGAQLRLLATIKRQSQQYRCTDISRPVEQTSGIMSLFDQ